MVKGLGIVSGAICVIAGIYLLGLEAAGQNSMLEHIAHGMGIYFIGKGIYTGTSVTISADTHSELSSAIKLWAKFKSINGGDQ